MQTFYLFGNYSCESIREISKARTESCTKLIEELGGEIILIHALLGQFDLAFIVKFPGNREAFKASLALTKSTGIAFQSCPAITVDELDKISENL